MENGPRGHTDAHPSSPTILSDPTNRPPPADKPENRRRDLTTSVASEKLRNVTDAVLSFLSSASNETLGACAIGLCATTYLVLGRIGLILIGAAGGIVLHATWESSGITTAGSQSNAADGSRRRRELGIEVVRRTLDWRDTSKHTQSREDANSSIVESSPEDKTLGYSDFRPATRAALTSLTDAVIRDYVRKVPLKGEFQSS